MSNIKKKDRSKSLVIILAILVVLMAGVLGFYVFGISPTDPDNSDEIVIKIEPGSGAYQILNQLDEAGLVKNAFCGKILVKVMPTDDIQAGTYAFSKDMNLTQIFTALNEQDFDYMVTQKVTIIEGATIPQAAAALSEVSGVSEEEILKIWSDKSFLKDLINDYWFITDEILKDGILYPLEGYLYPDTYFLPEGEIDIKSATIDMINTMEVALDPYKEDIEQKLGFTAHQFLTFASVVEKESLFDDDRPMIAGVFLNRLYEGMAMQSDITVLYALGESHVDVSIAETQVDSPYNTYKNPGLPIGPVCAVPARTMEDCINYEPSDYFFFFATEDGDVLYTKTYKEHQKVVEENKWY